MYRRGNKVQSVSQGPQFTQWGPPRSLAFQAQRGGAGPVGSGLRAGGWVDRGQGRAGRRGEWEKVGEACWPLRD